MVPPEVAFRAEVRGRVRLVGHVRTVQRGRERARRPRRPPARGRRQGRARARARTAGLAEARAARCHTIADLRAMAKRTVPKPTFDYVDGAAWDEVTARRNRSAFERRHAAPEGAGRRLVGRPAHDRARRGDRAADHRRADRPHRASSTRDGEVAVARAAHAAGTITTLSTMASYTLEEVAAASPGRRWFQLYVMKDRGLVDELLDRARGERLRGADADRRRAGRGRARARRAQPLQHPAADHAQDARPGRHPPALERRLRRQPADHAREPRLVGQHVRDAVRRA